jgi:hypothetical protein
MLSAQTPHPVRCARSHFASLITCCTCYTLLLQFLDLHLEMRGGKLGLDFGQFDATTCSTGATCDAAAGCTRCYLFCTAVLVCMACEHLLLSARAVVSMASPAAAAVRVFKTNHQHCLLR